MWPVFALDREPIADCHSMGEALLRNPDDDAQSVLLYRKAGGNTSCPNHP